MSAILMNYNAISVVKKQLSAQYPEEKSTHLSEALARSLGFRTYAALRASIKANYGVAPAYQLLNDRAFILRLHELNESPLNKDEDFFVFEWLGIPNSDYVISTRPVEWSDVDHKTLRQKAHRNILVSAINHLLLTGKIGLKADDNCWLNANNIPWPEPYVFEFKFCEIPTIGQVKNIGCGELCIDIICWPKADGKDWLGANFPEFRAGDCIATGWLERAKGAWLQFSKRPILKCRKPRLQLLADLKIEPAGFGDRGQFF